MLDNGKAQKIMFGDGWKQFILDSIDELNNERDHLKQMHWMNPRHYVSEFRTIGLSLPRQSGKTRFIAHNAKCGDIVLVPNHNIKRIYEQEYFCPAIAISNFQQPSDRIFQGIRGSYLAEMIRPHRIWVDEPTYDPRLVTEALNYYVKESSQIVIMLGTSRF